MERAPDRAEKAHNRAVNAICREWMEERKLWFGKCLGRFEGVKMVRSRGPPMGDESDETAIEVGFVLGRCSGQWPEGEMGLI